MFTILNLFLIDPFLAVVPPEKSIAFLPPIIALGLISASPVKLVFLSSMKSYIFSLTSQICDIQNSYFTRVTFLCSVSWVL